MSSVFSATLYRFISLILQDISQIYIYYMQLYHDVVADIKHRLFLTS
jgi:hypothetical protein